MSEKLPIKIYCIFSFPRRGSFLICRWAEGNLLICVFHNISLAPSLHLRASSCEDWPLGAILERDAFLQQDGSSLFPAQTQ